MALVGDDATGLEGQGAGGEGGGLAGVVGDVQDRQALGQLQGVDALGLVAGGEDDDGIGGDPGTVSAEQAATIHAFLDERDVDVVKFLEWAGVDSVEDIPAFKFREAVRLLERKPRK